MSTYREYTDLVRQLTDTGVPAYTAKQACENIDALDSQFVIVKHDVEDKPDKALRISKIEHQFRITATYYVHSFFLNNPGAVSILKQIQGLGHEIGYHYDVLDHNNGDKKSAIQEFREAVSRFADNGFNVKTICPHGNPIKKRVGYSSNKDFFLDNDIRKLFGDIEDIYITFPEMVEKDYLYVTDAGYAYSYRDAKTTKTDATERMNPLHDKDEISKMIREGHSMVISTHTHRYFRFACVNVARIGMFKIVRPAAKALYRTKCGKTLFDKFYFIAKKI